MYGIPIVIRFITTIAVVPIYTRVLSPADYGVLELLDLTSFIIASLIGSNLGVSVFYYYAAAPDAWGRKRALSTAYWGSFLLTGLTLAPLAASSALAHSIIGSASYAHALRIAIATVAFSFPAEVGLCCLRAQERVSLYSKLSAARLLAGAGLTLIFLLVAKLGLESILWSSLVITIATAIVTGILNRSSLQAGVSWKLFGKQVRYSWPLGASALATLILDFGDRYILRRYVSLADIGVYGLAYKFGMMINLCSLVFNHYWKPKMFSVVREPGGDSLYTRTYSYYVLVLSTIAVALSTLGLPLIELLVGKEFRVSIGIVPWVAVIYLIRVTGDYLRNAFYLTQTTFRETHITWLGAICCVAGYLVLIPRFALWGAVAATILSYSAMWIVSCVWAQRTRYFHFEFRRVGICFVWMLVLISARSAIGALPTALSLAAGAGILLAWLLGLWAFRWLEQSEIEEAKGLWSHAWRRYVAGRL
ncbi:MAG: lipopolysaccharide biosynthesis protein [Bryobacterales bacterium]|nr:lipopolysaccharide biosynthesis protein [Bryobacterales bacterium]